jgi:YVTN family beta-propeller protein
MKTEKISVTLLLLTAFGFSQEQALAAPSNYAIKQRWDMGNPVKWDYTDIDTERNRLFLSMGDHVQVVDLSSGQAVGIIPNTPGVHGIAFAQDLKLGFTSNGRADTVTVFDLDSLQVKEEIKISGNNPDAILYEPGTHQLYTFNGKSANVSVIDTVSLKQVASIAASGRPEFAVSDNAGKIFFNVEDKSEINVIDIATSKISAKWPLKGCEEPTGLAIDTAHSRLFSVCQNKLMVVTDAKTGKRVASVAIGEHPDAAIYDAETGLIFSSNGDKGGSLTVIKQNGANHYQAIAQVTTAQGAKTMAMDKKTKRIYLPTVIDGKFTVLVAGPAD